MLAYFFPLASSKAIRDYSLKTKQSNTESNYSHSRSFATNNPENIETTPNDVLYSIRFSSLYKVNAQTLETHQVFLHKATSLSLAQIPFPTLKQ